MHFFVCGHRNDRKEKGSAETALRKKSVVRRGTTRKGSHLNFPGQRSDLPSTPVLNQGRVQGSGSGVGLRARFRFQGLRVKKYWAYLHLHLHLHLQTASLAFSVIFVLSSRFFVAFWQADNPVATPTPTLSLSSAAKKNNCMKRRRPSGRCAETRRQTRIGTRAAAPPAYARRGRDRMLQHPRPWPWPSMHPRRQYTNQQA